jgi:hypothetical protein
MQCSEVEGALQISGCACMWLPLFSQGRVKNIATFMRMYFMEIPKLGQLHFYTSDMRQK